MVGISFEKWGNDEIEALIAEAQSVLEKRQRGANGWKTVQMSNGGRISSAPIPDRIMEQMPEASDPRAKLRWWRIGTLIAALLMLAGCVAIRLA